MATFPELEPNTRSYDFGLFPLTEEPSLSAGIVRFRHSTAPQNYQLTLGYNAITDAQATLIRNHYQNQGGGYRSFLLPAIIWKGHASNENIVPAETLWRYSETPEEEHLAVGRINVTITLISDGAVIPVIAPGFTDDIATAFAAGAATALNLQPSNTFTTLGSTNFFFNRYGYEFTVGANPLTVYALGVVAANTTERVMIHRVSDSVAVASADIFSNGTVVTTNITPVVLSANTQYTISYQAPGCGSRNLYRSLSGEVFAANITVNRYVFSSSGCNVIPTATFGGTGTSAARFIFSV